MNLDFENINLGATAGDKTGDGARTGGGKINRNFEKVKVFLETPDAILIQTGYALVGQDLTFNSGWKWRIATVEYTNPANVVINFPLATTGKSRLDVIVLTTSNTFLRVPGAESTTTPVAPSTPSGSLYVTVVLVADGAVSAPEEPQVNGAYVQKSERANVILTGSGVINMLTLGDEKATIVFKGTVTRLNTITYNSVPYNGKRITLFNAQSTPVTIGNSVSGYGVDFVFSDGQDYFLQPNQTIEFSFDTTFAPYAHHMFIGSMGITNWSELQGKPNTFTPSVHSHSYSEITDKPLTFNPSLHTHSISEVIGLQNGLDNKSNKSEGYFSLKHFKNYFTEITGYTANGFTPTYSNGKMIFTGGAGDFSRFISINGLKNTDENIEEEVVFRVSVLGFGVSIGKKSINTWYSASIYCHLDVISGIMKIWDGQGTAPANTIASKTIPAIVVGDIVKLKFTQLGNQIIFTYYNLTQGNAYQLSILGNLSTTKNFKIPNSSEMCVFNNSGTNEIISIKVTSFSNYNPDILVIGDSKSVGYSAKSNSLRWANNIASLGTVIVNAGDGDRTVEAMQTISYTKLIKAKYALMAIGRNDLGSGVASGIWQTNYANIVTQLQEQGTIVFHLLPVPEITLSDQSTLKNWIISTYGTSFTIDPSVGWSNATMLSSDNVHPNEVGHAFIAKKIIDSGIITPTTPITVLSKNNEVEQIITGVNANSSNYLPYSDGSSFQNSSIYRAAANRYGQGTTSPYSYGAGWESYEIRGSLFGLVSVGKIGSTTTHYFSSDGNFAYLGVNVNGVFNTCCIINSDGSVIFDKNNPSSTPSFNASARLEIRSTTQGFLPPRMTNSQRIAIQSPAIGLMVYCTDATEGLYVYKSTGWTYII